MSKVTFIQFSGDQDDELLKLNKKMLDAAGVLYKQFTDEHGWLCLSIESLPEASPPPSRVTIQFRGKPGAGKSTLLNRVRAVLSRNGVTVCQILEHTLVVELTQADLQAIREN